MRTSVPDVLREAVRDRHSNETFEKALSRVVRKHQGTFADYVDIVGRVRERAKRDSSSLTEAAKSLAAQE